MRARGSSLCDIAVLVVDLMHGLEPQTIESLKMLKDKQAPFVIALNKIDRLLDWTPIPNAPFEKTLKSQKSHTQREFKTRMQNAQTQLAEQGFNTALYTENKNMKEDVSIVPTSAHTGEGIPDLLFLLTQLTQKFMAKRLEFKGFYFCFFLLFLFIFIFLESVFFFCANIQGNVYLGHKLNSTHP